MEATESNATYKPIIYTMIGMGKVPLEATRGSGGSSEDSLKKKVYTILPSISSGTPLLR
jgi:hypothetical protein